MWFGKKRGGDNGGGVESRGSDDDRESMDRHSLIVCRKETERRQHENIQARRYNRAQCEEPSVAVHAVDICGRGDNGSKHRAPTHRSIILGEWLSRLSGWWGGISVECNDFEANEAFEGRKKLCSSILNPENTVWRDVDVRFDLRLETLDGEDRVTSSETDGKPDSTQGYRSKARSSTTKHDSHSVIDILRGLPKGATANISGKGTSIWHGQAIDFTIEGDLSLSTGRLSFTKQHRGRYTNYIEYVGELFSISPLTVDDGRNDVKGLNGKQTPHGEGGDSPFCVSHVAKHRDCVCGMWEGHSYPEIRARYSKGALVLHRLSESRVRSEGPSLYPFYSPSVRKIISDRSKLLPHELNIDARHKTCFKRDPNDTVEEGMECFNTLCRWLSGESLGLEVGAKEQKQWYGVSNSDRDDAPTLWLWTELRFSPIEKAYDVPLFTNRIDGRPNDHSRSVKDKECLWLRARVSGSGTSRWRDRDIAFDLEGVLEWPSLRCFLVKQHRGNEYRNRLLYYCSVATNLDEITGIYRGGMVTIGRLRPKYYNPIRLLTADNASFEGIDTQTEKEGERKKEIETRERENKLGQRTNATSSSFLARSHGDTDKIEGEEREDGASFIAARGQWHAWRTHDGPLQTNLHLIERQVHGMAMPLPGGGDLLSDRRFRHKLNRLRRRSLRLTHHLERALTGMWEGESVSARDTADGPGISTLWRDTHLSFSMNPVLDSLLIGLCQRGDKTRSPPSASTAASHSSSTSCSVTRGRVHGCGVSVWRDMNIEFELTGDFTWILPGKIDGGSGTNDVGTMRLSLKKQHRGVFTNQIIYTCLIHWNAGEKRHLTHLLDSALRAARRVADDKPSSLGGKTALPQRQKRRIKSNKSLGGGDASGYPRDALVRDENKRKRGRGWGKRAASLASDGTCVIRGTHSRGTIVLTRSGARGGDFEGTETDPRSSSEGASSSDDDKEVKEGVGVEGKDWPGKILVSSVGAQSVLCGSDSASAGAGERARYGEASDEFTSQRRRDYTLFLSGMLAAASTTQTARKGSGKDSRRMEREESEEEEDSRQLAQLPSAQLHLLKNFREIRGVTEKDHDIVLRDMGYTAAQYSQMEAASLRGDTKTTQEASLLEGKDAEICKICFERSIDTIILPCGHLCVCMECGEEIVESSLEADQDPTCPICRADIKRLQRVYRS